MTPEFDVAWLLAGIILFFGAWVQTAIGFGLAIVAAPVLLGIAPLWVPVVLTITALILSVINTWHQRKYLHWQSMLIPMMTRIPGTVLGIWVLTHISLPALQLLVAGAVLFAVVISLTRITVNDSPVNLGLAGLVSGFTGSTTAIGGPPMALIMQHGQPEAVRANLSFYFAYSCIISLIGYSLAGILTRPLLIEGLSVQVFMLIGFWAGIKTRHLVNPVIFRYMLLGLCLAAGIGAGYSGLAAIISG